MSALLNRHGPLAAIPVGIALLASMGLSRAGAADPVIPLPDEDRERLEKGLGPGIVGKAVAAPTIDDPATFLKVAGGRSWRFRYTSGDKKDKVEAFTLSPRKRPTGELIWKADTGPTTSMYLRTGSDGSIELVSDENRDEGVITRYSPPEPLWVSNLKPGDVRRSKHDVKVYDLNDPKDVSHRGYLNLVYTYVGAYEITVPAGTFEVVLLRWEYKGKIGPASIEDVQYRLLAKDIGPVALIEKFDASAFLVYQNHTKVGRVLVSHSGKESSGNN